MRLVRAGEVLPVYAARLVARAADKTGYPVVLCERDGLGYDFLLRMASPDQPWHDLAFVPEYRAYWLHFLVSASYKVLRLWAAPPAERLVPASAADRGLPWSDEAELRARFPELPDRVFRDLSVFLYQGLVRQVTSMPLDLRVERALHHALPEHRVEQERYLARQVADVVPHFSPSIQAATPPRVYAASTAMNVALALEASALTGADVDSVVRASPHYELGVQLDGLLQHVPVDGHVGDRALTDVWASRLGVRDWYTWTPVP